MKKIYSLLLGGLLAVGAHTASAAINVPYSSPIAVDGGFDTGWVVIDANNDGETWDSYSTSFTSIGGGSKSARAYGTTRTGTYKDDWLISPAIHLEANKEYRVFYGLKAESSSHPQDLKVFATTSNEPDAIKLSEPLKTYEQYKNATVTKEDISFTPSETGDYYFSFYCTSVNDNWYMFVGLLEVFENNFAPAMVTNLKAERDAERAVKCDLSWTLPTKSVFGDNFTDDQTVEKVNIYRDGGEQPITTLEGAQTSFQDTEATGLTAGIHTYEVEVVVAGAKSGKASVTTKYVGPVTPLAVPGTWTITSQDDMDDWTSVNGENAANKTNWTYYSYGPYGRFSSSTDVKEENYFIAPPFQVDEPGYYLVTLNAMIGSTSYVDSNILQVRYGSAPTAEAMTNVICDHIKFTSSSKTPYSYVVNITAAGTYYFGAVAASEAPKSTTFGVYSIGVEKTEKTPAPVTKLTVTPGEDEALEAILNWVCPEESSNGEELLDSEYSIQVFKGDELLETLAGGTSSYVDNSITASGSYTYTVKTVAPEGASVGGVTVKSPWIGSHVVALPYSTSFKATDDSASIWDIIDQNDDEKTWKLETSESSYRCYPPVAPEEDGTYKYEDYLLSPYFELEPGYYKVQFRAFGPANGKMNVGLVEARTFVPGRSELMFEDNITTNSVSSLDSYNPKKSYLYHIEEAGVYQMVFAADEACAAPSPTSTGAYYQLGIGEFSFAAFPVLPDVVADLNVVAADDEVLEAYVTWTNPTTTNVEGVALTAIEKAVVIRDGEEVAEITEGLTPGEQASFTDTAENGLTGGPHTYSVEIYNANGKSESAAPVFNLEWVGSGLDITGDGVTHIYSDFDNLWTFVDVDNNQKSSYDGWSISGTTAMKVDETNSEGKYDDWAVSPRFNILHMQPYTVTIEFYKGATYRDIKKYPFDLYVGNGDDFTTYQKVKTFTAVDENATAAFPETDNVIICGVEGLNADAPVAVAEEDENDSVVEDVPVPAGGLKFALHAYTKGGVFVKSFTIAPYAGETTGVENIASDNETNAVYYNLQGVRVNNPENGVYIVVEGKNVSKQLIRK